MKKIRETRNLTPQQRVEFSKNFSKCSNVFTEVLEDSETPITRWIFKKFLECIRKFLIRLRHISVVAFFKGIYEVPRKFYVSKNCNKYHGRWMEGLKRA